MTLDTFEILSNNRVIYVSINSSFFEKIKTSVVKNYKSLRQFNLQELKINYGTLKSEFRTAYYHHLPRLLRIAELLEINKEEVFSNIKKFRALGSHRKIDIVLPRKIIPTENFIEGYALYLAEGNTGFSGRTIPRKLRFTNSEIDVIRFFIQWLRTNFSGIDFYLNVILPSEETIQKDFISQVGEKLDLDTGRIKIKNGYYNKKIKYKVCCDSAIMIDLILSIERIIKKICLNDKKLMTAYIRGMMIGEGTPYFNRSRYVRIEMKNEKEIKYLASLFKLLGYKYKIALRNNRENMWSIYIGAKQLKKFYNEIGFGSHKKRQEILEKAVNKRLRINQYC